MFGNDDRNKSLIFIFILGLVLRILFACYLEDKIYWEDGFDYDGLATRLLEGKGYITEHGIPTAFRAPGYPFYLAGVYSIFGHHFGVVRIVQSLIDSVTLIILFVISKNVFNRKIASVSAFIYSIYPLFIYSANTLFPTTLFMFLLSLVIYFLFKSEQKPTVFRSTCLGFIFGLSALTVPIILMFFLLAMIWLYFFFKMEKRKVLLNAAMTTLTMILILCPWLIRNDKIFNKPFLIATNAGYNFWMGNNRWATASTGNSISIPEYLSQKLSKAKSEVEKETIFYQDAFQYIKNNPGRFVSLTFQKVINLWQLYPTPTTGYKMMATLSKMISIVSYSPVLILAIFGLIFSWRERRKYTLLFILLFVSFTIGYAFFITKARFRLPLDPYLIILASYSINTIWKFPTKESD